MSCRIPNKSFNLLESAKKQGNSWVINKKNPTIEAKRLKFIITTY